MSTRKPMRWVIALVSLVLIVPTLAFAAPKFPPLTGRVVDEAQMLSPAAEARLTQELATLEAQTGHQLVVATLPDLQGYEIEDYGYQLLRAWGIGRKEQDDGVILIVAPNQKKVRIEVGYGLEPVLTDALASLIIQRAILPAFKAGNMEQGVVDGAEAIARQIGLPKDQQAQAVAAAEAQAASTRADAAGDSDGGVPLVIVLIVLFWVVTGLLRAFGSRRRSRGSGLWWILPFLLSGPGGSSRRGGGWSGGGGGGGFSGGGGSGGGGGASGSW